MQPPGSPALQAFIAASRFGFGARGDDLARIGPDAAGWLESQLDPRFAENSALTALSQTIETAEPFRDILKNKREIADHDKDDADLIETLKSTRQAALDRYIHEIAIRMDVAAQSDAPFFERLVHFWSNHFTVSARKWGDVPLVVGFERDAIRPYVMGNFEDMLVAVVKNPAMQIYLDNFQSAGPGTETAKTYHRGLNENLAREVLELHTLGAGGGYTQGDVTEFAKMLTGWGIEAQGAGADSWAIHFSPDLHEPGDKTLLEKIYHAGGQDEALAALHMLARHPKTADFIALKLARHFIADDPPAEAVAALSDSFKKSRGDLMPLYRTLIHLQAPWAVPLPKVKTPNDLIVSLIRCTGMKAEDGKLLNAYHTLEQMPFSAPSPAGWSDRAKDWMSAEALLQRMDLAQTIAAARYVDVDPLALMESSIGPVASSTTRDAVTKAGSRQESLALLLASPEFQRR